jgi:hypothetical protein
MFMTVMTFLSMAKEAQYNESELCSECTFIKAFYRCLTQGAVRRICDDSDGCCLPATGGHEGYASPHGHLGFQLSRESGDTTGQSLVDCFGVALAGVAGQYFMDVDRVDVLCNETWW